MVVSACETIANAGVPTTFTSPSVADRTISTRIGAPSWGACNNTVVTGMTRLSLPLTVPSVVSIEPPIERSRSSAAAESASSDPRSLDGTISRHRGSSSKQPSAQGSDAVTTPFASHVATVPFVQAVSFGSQSRQPMPSSQPRPHSTRSKSVPVSLHVIARSPRHASNVPGSHPTAMHVSRWPSISPLRSQKGNAGSVHVPSRHERGFGLVHAANPRHNNTTRHRIWRWLINMGGAVDRTVRRLREISRVERRRSLRVDWRLTGTRETGRSRERSRFGATCSTRSWGRAATASGCDTKMDREIAIKILKSDQVARPQVVESDASVAACNGRNAAKAKQYVSRLPAPQQRRSGRSVCATASSFPDRLDAASGHCMTSGAH
jgi:hypothetical protein